MVRFQWVSRSLSPRKWGLITSAASALVMPGYRPLINPKAERAADDLGGDEVRNRRRSDPGETVGEHATDRDGRVGEAGRTGEEVGRADVGPDRCGRRWDLPERARAKITKIKPTVARTSEMKCGPVARCLVEMEMAASRTSRWPRSPRRCTQRPERAGRRRRPST